MDESMETDQVYLDDTEEGSDHEESQNIFQGGLEGVNVVDVEHQLEVIAESETESELDEDSGRRERLTIGIVERLRGDGPLTGEVDRPRGPTPNESSRPDSPIMVSDDSSTEQEEQENRSEPAQNSESSQVGSRMNLPVVTEENQNSSVCEFMSPRKCRPPETPADTGAGDFGEQEDEAECCPICFESWTNSGSHRLVSLKCGHLFGQSCIEKWLKGQGGKCPHCNTSAKKKDIRLIYAKALKAIDTSERDQALAACEKEKSAREKAELESAQSRLRYQSALEECKRLQAELTRYKNMASLLNSKRGVSDSASTSNQVMPTGSQTTAAAPPSRSFVLDRTVRISESGGCRVMAFSPHQAILCLSQPSSSPLFPGFGIKKLSCLDFKTMQYVAVHSKPIRDIAFNAANPNAYMLTASMDKNIKVTSLTSNSVVQTYSCSMPIWSCCWNADNWNYLYAGQQNGSVLVFDMRQTTGAVQHINTQGSRSPVVSLQYLPQKEGATCSCGGLLVGQLDKCSFYEQKSAEDYRVHVLPADGNLTCLSLEEGSRHVLMTFRPNARYPTVRHQMSTLVSEQSTADPGDHICSCRQVHTFQGGSAQKLLSRNRLLAHPSENGNLIVCGCDESNQSVQLWDATTGVCMQRLTSPSPVLDLCPLPLGDEHYLVSLTEKQAQIHKWT